MKKAATILIFVCAYSCLHAQKARFYIEKRQAAGCDYSISCLLINGTPIPIGDTVEITANKGGFDTIIYYINKKTGGDTLLCRIRQPHLYNVAVFYSTGFIKITDQTLRKIYPARIVVHFTARAKKNIIITAIGNDNLYAIQISKAGTDTLYDPEHWKYVPEPDYTDDDYANLRGVPLYPLSPHLYNSYRVEISEFSDCTDTTVQCMDGFLLVKKDGKLCKPREYMHFSPTVTYLHFNYVPLDDNDLHLKFNPETGQWSLW